MTARVSLTTIVKNEAATLATALASVRDLVDEIIVVDTGSSDASKHIAQQHSARVFDLPWPDSFAAARNQAIQHATGQWLLWLDADEYLDDDNRDKLRALLANLPDDNSAYVMQQRCHAANGSATLVAQVRLFRNSPDIRFDFGNVLGFFSHRKAAEQLAVYSPLSADDILHRYLDPRLEDDFESGRMSLPAFRALVRQRCQVTCGDEQLDLAIADMFAPNDEVCALVPALKPRYRLVLLSNTNELHALHFRRQFADTLAHFDALVLSHEVGLRKPCPDIYARCCQLAGCSPKQSLFIDDLPANIDAARACGWQGIVYHRGLDLRRELRPFGIELAPSASAIRRLT